MFYEIHERIDFGMNAGYTVSEIYKHAPQYLEYLLTNEKSELYPAREKFCTNLEMLELQPYPTQFEGDIEINSRLAAIKRRLQIHIL